MALYSEAEYIFPFGNGCLKPSMSQMSKQIQPVERSRAGQTCAEKQRQETTWPQKTAAVLAP